MTHRECYMEAVNVVAAEARARGDRTPVGDAMQLLAAEMRVAARDMPKMPASEIDDICAWLPTRIGVLIRDGVVGLGLGDRIRDHVISTLSEVLVRELRAGVFR